MEIKNFRHGILFAIDRAGLIGVVAIKLARAVYFMLKNKTVFDPERLIAALAKK